MKMLLAAVLLLPATAFAKPPPGFCDQPQNRAECAWWEAQRQADGIVSCCGAPGSDGHVLADGDWIETGDPRFPFRIKIYWNDGDRAHFTWAKIPAYAVVAPQALPEPDPLLRTEAKVWYAPSWNTDDSPNLLYFRWYCFEPVEGL